MKNKLSNQIAMPVGEGKRVNFRVSEAIKEMLFDISTQNKTPMGIVARDIITSNYTRYVNDLEKLTPKLYRKILRENIVAYKFLKEKERAEDKLRHDSRKAGLKQYNRKQMAIPLGEGKRIHFRVPIEVTKRLSALARQRFTTIGKIAYWLICNNINKYVDRRMETGEGVPLTLNEKLTLISTMDKKANIPALLRQILYNHTVGFKNVSKEEVNEETQN